MQKSPKGVVIRVNKGNEAVCSFRFSSLDLMKPEDIYYVIGASGDPYHEVMGPEMLRWDRLRVRRNMREMLITFESQRGHLHHLGRQMKLASIRFFLIVFQY